LQLIGQEGRFNGNTFEPLKTKRLLPDFRFRTGKCARNQRLRLTNRLAGIRDPVSEDKSPYRFFNGRRSRLLFNVLTMLLNSGTYIALAEVVLFLHGLFIAWVAVGFLLTRNRPVLRWLHIASLCWGIAVDVLPWMCPLTLLENWLEGRAGIEPYQGGFLLHYLDKLVYPDIPVVWLTFAAVMVCAANLGFYAWQLLRAKAQKHQLIGACATPEKNSDLR
jgi:hypothetical protein